MGFRGRAARSAPAYFDISFLKSCTTVESRVVVLPPPQQPVGDGGRGRRDDLHPI